MKKFIDKLASWNAGVDKTMQQFRFRKKSFRNLFALILFIFCLNHFYDYVGVYSFLSSRPTSIHSSAQCQRASIALNYYETDMNFFKPRVQRYSEMGGVTGVEFPVVYYADAVAYKCFGFNEMYGRVIGLLILTLGLFLFYLLTNRFLNNSILAILVVLSAAASPVLLFYTPNFMPDSPSAALVLMAWYFFFKYTDSGNSKHLYAFMIVSTLAALIKVVALISLVALCCVIVLDQLGFYKSTREKKIFDKPWRWLITSVVCLLIVVCWYAYAHWLAKAYKNETFSLTPEMGDAGTLKNVLANIKDLWLYHYYAYESYVLMLFAIGTMILLAKFVNRLLFSITFLFFIGNILFVYFFLNQFINHDYYIISILPLVFFLFLTMADALVRFSNKYVLFLKLVFFVLIVFNLKETILNCRINYEYRYSNEMYFWGGDFRAYYDLEPRLREAGIKRTDLTISGFDDTFCSSLYLMNQIGIPISTADSKERITEMVRYKDSKYLILNDSAKFNKIYPNNFADDIVLTHRGLIVYKLPHNQ